MIEEFTVVLNTTNTTAKAFVSDPADTSFLFTACCLVFIMTPGLGFFYAGLVRQKNAAATIFQSVATIFVVGIQWWFFGFSFAFGDGGPLSPFIGGINYFMMIDDKLAATNHSVAPTVSIYLFFLFELMFAGITPALITGGMAERLKFSTWIFFVPFWVTFVYCPIAHWTWHPDGWLFKLGELDFAGGTVVHICCGASALVFSIFMKQRKGAKSLFTWLKDKIFKPKKDIIVNWQESNTVITHSIPNVLLGTALLWFGWFGFNGGSAIQSTNLASIAYMNTMLCACSGGLTWMIVVWIVSGKPKIIAVCEGIVAGLVAITPGCAFVNPGFAILIGVINSIISPLVILLKSYIIDDTLDAVGVHLTGGIVGTFLTGIFASKDIYFYGTGNSIGGGWISGNWIQVPIQMAGIACTFAWSFVITFILFWIFYIFGWNVNDYEERIGLDSSQHDEQSYIYEPPEKTDLIEGERKPFSIREFVPALIKKPKDMNLKEFIQTYGKPREDKKDIDDDE